MAGLWLEEFEKGRVFEHEIRRTVTEADNIWFCGATYNPAAIPVFAGDTVHVKTTVIDIRDSKSRQNAGIVTFLHQGFNQDNKEVCTCTRQALMLRKPV